MSATAKKVHKNSLAYAAGIRSGDVILKINNSDFCDILEYRFLCSEPKIEIEFNKADNKVVKASIDNPYFEDIGIEFNTQLIDEMRSCRNKCVFCFIDQLPKGMRSSLYFKDDDTRMSFLMGNYVTLTNLSDEEIDKIISMRISPIHISVHTTNEELRVKMLNNKFASKINSQIKKFYDAKITMHCQIVACPGINDGEELKNTLKDLSGYFPYVSSISVVPVGISKHREGLFCLDSYTKETSLNVVNDVTKLQNEYLHKFGSRLVYLADEFYMDAGLPLPDADHYEGFPQIENGVGMMSSFLEEFNMCLPFVPEKIRKREVSVATGMLSYPVIKNLAEILEKKCSGLKINVYGIENDFFGKKITVSGLVCGCDIIKSLSGKSLGKELFLPENMFRANEDVLLDDVTLKELKKALKVKVTKTKNDGFEFIKKLCNIRR